MGGWGLNSERQRGEKASDDLPAREGRQVGRENTPSSSVAFLASSLACPLGSCATPERERACARVARQDMRASLATIPRPQGISSDAVCVSFSPSAFTFDTEPHNQLCNLASFDATLTPRTNSHTREMYSQRFVGLMCANF